MEKRCLFRFDRIRLNGFMGMGELYNSSEQEYAYKKGRRGFPV
ncbi:MAG: hypothetical protein U0V75_09905 [Ferruginibacter sp.]